MTTCNCTGACLNGGRCPVAAPLIVPRGAVESEGPFPRATFAWEPEPDDTVPIPAFCSDCQLQERCCRDDA